MRTSTVVFLVLFLFLASSRDRRSAVFDVVDGVRATVHDITAEWRDHQTVSREREASASSSQARQYRKQLNEIDSRSTAASKAIRAVDRSIRQLRDRIAELRDGSASRCSSRVVSDSIELISRQVGELDAEKQQLVELQIALKNERVQVQSALDLESVRAERKQLEGLMQRDAGASPLDSMAQQMMQPMRWTSH